MAPSPYNSSSRVWTSQNIAMKKPLVLTAVSSCRHEGKKRPPKRCRCTRREAVDKRCQQSIHDASRGSQNWLTPSCRRQPLTAPSNVSYNTALPPCRRIAGSRSWLDAVLVEYSLLGGGMRREYLLLWTYLLVALVVLVVEADFVCG